MTVPALSRHYALLLLLALAVLFAARAPGHNGDAVEYTLQTVALAEHGSPDIRYGDIAIARRLAPELTHVYQTLEQDMRANKETLYAAFVRGNDGKVYAVHFFGYAALATLPYKLLASVGLPPFKCFQAVNLAAILVLGLSLRRLFGGDARAAYGLALFAACGGLLYWNWTGPEFLSAAALLSGMLLYASGAPVRGAVLAGLAAQQNPTILFFLAMAPLLHFCIVYGRDASLAATPLRAALATVLGRRQLLALALGMAMLALPPLFNLWKFGVPNIIVKLYSNPAYVNGTRLHSFFFDLSQGMVVGVPALLLALGLWGWRNPQRGRAAAVLAACALLTLALVVPALAVLNWNSGAVGMMRYAFWAAMPLLFALLWRLSEAPRWPRTLCAVLLAAQLGCMAHALSYPITGFSPLAELVLRHAPGLYHPEPEIFAERLAGAEIYLDTAHIYAYPREGEPVKRMYNRAQPGIEALLCGPGMELAPGGDITDSHRNWRYVDGAPHCQREDPHRVRLGMDQFRQQPQTLLASGWSTPEGGGGAWDGVWTNGERSQLRIAVPAHVRQRMFTISGHYFGRNLRTRVWLEGKDLGWLRLDQLPAIALPEDKRAGSQVLLELRHEAPQQPGPQDLRRLAFFLQEIVIR